MFIDFEINKKVYSDNLVVFILIDIHTFFYLRLVFIYGSILFGNFCGRGSRDVVAYNI